MSSPLRFSFLIGLALLVGCAPPPAASPTSPAAQPAAAKPSPVKPSASTTAAKKAQEAFDGVASGKKELTEITDRILGE